MQQLHQSLPLKFTILQSRPRRSLNIHLTRLTMARSPLSLETEECQKTALCRGAFPHAVTPTIHNVTLTLPHCLRYITLVSVLVPLPNAATHCTTVVTALQMKSVLRSAKRAPENVRRTTLRVNRSLERLHNYESLEGSNKEN